MNVCDPSLELIDPNPDVHQLFIEYDKIFFKGILQARCVVRWSTRMTLCAGTCTFDGAMNVIALSKPLLSLRPRSDSINTLLHEMIHAFLFLTKRDRDRDGHGVDFQAHMHRINKNGGSSITIYHTFHDEVKAQRNHVWQCDGVCRSRPPYFGKCARSMNRPPQKHDNWWDHHQKTCGGNWVKISEPEKKEKKKTEKKEKKETVKKIVKYEGSSQTVKKNSKSHPDISKYFKKKSETKIETDDGQKTSEISNTEDLFQFSNFKTEGHVLGGFRKTSRLLDKYAKIDNMKLNTSFEKTIKISPQIASASSSKSTSINNSTFESKHAKKPLKPLKTQVAKPKNNEIIDLSSSEDDIRNSDIETSNIENSDIENSVIIID